MCSKPNPNGSNVLIVGALFLIIVEINQTDCNSILPNVGARGHSAATTTAAAATAAAGLTTINTQPSGGDELAGNSTSSRNGHSNEETTTGYLAASERTTTVRSSKTTNAAATHSAYKTSSSIASTSNASSSLGNGFEGQIPLERLPSNTLLKYTAYKDVSILHFRIPTDTRTAFFSFKAYEESKSAFRKYSLKTIPR